MEATQAWAREQRVDTKKRIPRAATRAGNNGGISWRTHEDKALLPPSPLSSRNLVNSPGTRTRYTGWHNTWHTKCLSLIPPGFPLHPCGHGGQANSYHHHWGEVPAALSALEESKAVCPDAVKSSPTWQVLSCAGTPSLQTTWVHLKEKKKRWPRNWKTGQ